MLRVGLSSIARPLSRTGVCARSTAPFLSILHQTSTSPAECPASHTASLTVRSLHTTTTVCRNAWFKEPDAWLTYNDIVYPPTEPGQPQRPAEICHQMTNIRCNKKKLWYLTLFLRGMSVDEALKQLQFHPHTQTKFMTELITEAVEVAVRDFNVEFRSNLWICDLNATKAHTIKGQRKHGRGRWSVIHYRYAHLFIRLREGKPPKHYYAPLPTGKEKMEEYMKEWRERTVKRSL